MKQPFYIKNLLFHCDPEWAHNSALFYFRFLKKTPFCEGYFKKKYFFTSKRIHQNILGLEFKNPLGLAAGFDKNGKVDSFLGALGFGFYELGTVTLKAQSGFLGKRIHRFPEVKALVNRMGFPNEGVDVVRSRLEARFHDVPRGMSLGKNATTLVDRASLEYAALLAKSFSFSDYFAINISSPNTPELTKLQGKEFLSRLLSDIDQANQTMADKYGVSKKPVFIKISPDLSDENLKELIALIKDRSQYGVIATNTTNNRKYFSSMMPEQGGLSGEPLKELSTHMIRKVYELTEGKIPIIGCGGIFTVEDAIEKIKAGASLLQIYTSFVYYGPSLVRQLSEGIDQYLRFHGIHHISELHAS
ncbi:MAG: quinone-dependent dihydroorotate dehydrogenase [Deltaproteobacteria bacterium]|nr:quinone-dependent dihydroorotate dehydrogenase [Deltaproteobacteria bacterium]